VFAYHGAGGNIGTAAGPLCTALLLSVFHWRIAAVVLFVPAAVAAFVGMRISFDDIKSKDGDNPDSMRGAFTETLVDSRRLFTVGFSIAFITVLLYGTYYRGLLTFLPDILGNSSLDDLTILSYSLGPAEYIYTSMLTFGIAGQYAGGKLTDRIPSRTAFLGALSSLVVLALLFILVQGQGFVPLVLVSLALGFFVYATAPIYQVVIAEHVPRESRPLLWLHLPGHVRHRGPRGNDCRHAADVRDDNDTVRRTGYAGGDRMSLPPCPPVALNLRG